MGDNRIGTKWYAIYTYPRQESVADQGLRVQGYQTFAPVARVRRRRKLPHRGYIVEHVDLPYFPRYIFVALFGRHGESFRGVRDTMGVAAICGTSEGPLEIPHALMDELMAKADGEGRMAHIDKLARALYKPGTLVRFKDNNALQGLIAQISVDCGNKVRLLVDVLGAQREITVAPEQVGLASK